MITQEAIKEIYKKYSKKPESIDELNMPPLFEAANVNHGIEVDEEKITINSLPQSSIFRIIPLRNINAILEFEETVAIVLHSSIIFLNKADNRSFIHFRPLEPSMWDRLKMKMGPKKNQ